MGAAWSWRLSTLLITKLFLYFRHEIWLVQPGLISYAGNGSEKFASSEPLAGGQGFCNSARNKSRYYFYEELAVMVPGWTQILLVVVLLVLLFGRGKISDLMGDVAKGIKSFKKGMADDEEVAQSDTAKTINHEPPCPF